MNNLVSVVVPCYKQAHFLEEVDIKNGNVINVFVDGDNDFVQDVGEPVITQVTWANYPSVSLGANTFDNSSGRRCQSVKIGLPTRPIK